MVRFWLFVLFFLLFSTFCAGIVVLIVALIDLYVLISSAPAWQVWVAALVGTTVVIWRFAGIVYSTKIRDKKSDELFEKARRQGRSDLN